MDALQQLIETEELKKMMARYSVWGDTGQWEKFGTLFDDDLEVVIDAGPRANPEADPRIAISGKESFIQGMSAYTEGFTTHHQMVLPDITIADENHASAVWNLHDYVKTPGVIFNGWGHMHHDYVRVNGEWKIRRVHTTRLMVDEEWL
ncbi:MAG TPA: nuclear transport factor 2 family protein [Microbacteriaceae bacterium]|jgi:hypothetical protein|nr:nuclear transport factor 2 family protein [Microbacteriaceae bacterium]